MNNIYKNGRYILNNPTWHSEDSPWKAGYILKMLSYTNVDEIKTVYEIGCGAGEILNQLYSKLSDDINYYGFEISPQALKLCQERQKDRLSFFNEDLLEKTSDGYDLLLLINVLEHVNDFSHLLKKVKERTRNKVIWVPLELSAQSVVRGSYLNSVKRFGHIHFFTKDLFLTMLDELGYDIIHWSYVPNAIELDDRGFKAKMMKVPRKLLFRLTEDFSVKLLGGFSLIVLAK